MSRCFPFPPPGYETTNRPEDLDVLKEAKRKEKKHKKEKKEKERKKDKDKEKDGSNDRHRSKKDRKDKKEKKEKHKDRKKDKEDRSKDKEKSSISEESTLLAKLDGKCEDSVHPKEHSKPDISIGKEGNLSSLSERRKVGIRDNGRGSELGAQPVQELDRRIRDDNGRGGELAGSTAVHNKDHGMEAVVVRTSSKVGIRGNGRGSELAVQPLQKMDRRIRDDSGRGGELAGNTAVHNKDHGMEAVAVRTSSKVPQAEEKYNRFNHAKVDPDRLKNEFGRNSIAKDGIPVVGSKDNEIPRPLERRTESKFEVKDKYKKTSENKEGNRDKKIHEKEKVMEKEKTKAKAEQDMLKVVGTSGVISNKSSGSLNSINRVSEGNIRKRKDMDSNGYIRKRKDMDSNGFLHELESRPSKIRKPAHDSTVNGRKPEAAPRSPLSKSSHHNVGNHIRPDNKHRLINGMIQSQTPSPSTPKPSTPVIPGEHGMPVEQDRRAAGESNFLNDTVASLECEIAEASSRKPPHPDSKYLAEVLSVPTMLNWSENDVECWWEWDTKKGPPNKFDTKPAEVKEELRVWSEAVRIESADICALPYVIPY